MTAAGAYTVTEYRCGCHPAVIWGLGGDIGPILNSGPGHRQFWHGVGGWGSLPADERTFASVVDLEAEHGPLTPIGVDDVAALLAEVTHLRGQVAAETSRPSWVFVGDYPPAFVQAVADYLAAHEDRDVGEIGRRLRSAVESDGKPTPEQEHARAVARTLLAAMAEAIRAGVNEDGEDGGDRLALADVFDAAHPYVGEPYTRPLVLPIAQLAQRMYRAAAAAAEDSIAAPASAGGQEQLIGPLTAAEWAEFRQRDDDGELLQCCSTTSAMRDVVFRLLRNGGGKEWRGIFAMAYVDMLDHDLPTGRGGELLAKLRAFYVGDQTDDELRERVARIRERAAGDAEPAQPLIEVLRDDEHLEVRIDGQTVASANYDEHGSSGMAAVEAAALAVARALGAEVVDLDELDEPAEGWEREEQWAISYTLNGDPCEPGHGGHVFGSREEAEAHLGAWRRLYPNLTYTDEVYHRREVLTGRWVPAERAEDPHSVRAHPHGSACICDDCTARDEAEQQGWGAKQAGENRG